MRNRIILLLLFVFITILAGIGQTPTKQTNDNLTPAKLKQKYGLPNVKGQYKVRPEIGLTAKFKENGQPLEMRIEPLSSSEEKMAETDSPKLMSSDKAEEVLNEFVPEGKRGKKGNTVDIVSSCLIDSVTQYELLTVGIAKRCEGPEEGTYSIRVIWKK